MATENLLETFRARLGEVMDLRAAAAVLQWDMEVCMPPKGAPARGRQLATLSALAHRLFTADEMGRLLEDLRDSRESLTLDQAKLVEETAYDYERARQLPETFVERFSEEQSRAYEVWTKARAASDFEQFRPNLETMVDLLRQKAEYHGYADTPYDALLEDYERGALTKEVAAVFAALAPKQRDIVARIAAKAVQTPQWIDQEWDEQAQWDFSLRVLRDMGYDFEAGRQDRSVHPFSTNFDIHDVRITTRVDPRELFSCLTGSMHEGGHALYEQGFDEADRRTTLAAAPSLGMHESQSRMWENTIGRSLPFWRHYAPALRAAHPGKLDRVSPEELHRAINRVAPTFIRVEADECTYNLHIILRFEIEVALIEGTLQVADVPAAWNEKMRDYLGLDVSDDAHGCLQDIHWAHGGMGYFPTYALGNLYAAQIFERIERDMPDLWDQVGQGSFQPLLGWLREHIHRFGRRKSAAQLVADITGEAPGHEAFLRYLERKYGAIYEL
jgi:carboxypeptidase Taq